MLPIKLTITSIVDKIPASTQETHDPTFESEIRMVVDGMVGPADELADDHIPAITFPLRLAGDVSPHPIKSTYSLTQTLRIS